MEVKPVEPNQLGANRDGLHPYRLVFAKTGSARFLSHLEMASVFQRAMRRADLPLAYSRGYKPSPRISFGDALPLGLESRAEVMKVILRQPVAASEIADRLNVELPIGLKVLEAEEKRRSDLQTTSKLVTYEVIFPDGAWLPEGSHLYERQLLVPLRQKTKRGEVLIPLENRVTRLETLNSNRIRFSLIQGRNDHIRVRDLLIHIFGLSTDRVQDTRIMKTSAKPIV